LNIIVHIVFFKKNIISNLKPTVIEKLILKQKVDLTACLVEIEYFILK